MKATLTDVKARKTGGVSPSTMHPLSAEELRKMDAYWRACHYLAVGMIYLKYDFDAIFMAGPGHCAPGVLGPIYLEGTYSEIYPSKSEGEEGMRAFFKNFSFPGGLGSHCTPETPGCR